MNGPCLVPVRQAMHTVRACVALLLAGVTSAGAAVQLVEYQAQGIRSGDGLSEISVQYDNGGRLAARTVKAGIISLIPTANTPSAYRMPFGTYCTDVAKSLPSGLKTFQNTPFVGHAQEAAPTWAIQGDAAYNAAFLYYRFAHVPLDKQKPAERQVYAAGLQLAIWETLYDSASVGTRSFADADFDKGRFRVVDNARSHEALALADWYLEQAAREQWVQYSGGWLQNTDLSQQSLFAAENFFGTYVPVPEPSTCAAGLLLGGWVCWSGLRQHRRARR